MDGIDRWWRNLAAQIEDEDGLTRARRNIEAQLCAPPDWERQAGAPNRPELQAQMSVDPFARRL